MDVPANHPGALADVGYEHERWRVVRAADASVHMEGDGALRGARKAIAAAPDDPALVVCYDLPAEAAPFATEACLSPDYLTLLHDGRRAAVPVRGARRRGVRAGVASVWVAFAADEAVGFASPGHREAGHGRNVRVEARCAHFHLVVGCGETHGRHVRRLIDWGRTVLHP
jgi:hypothetical protein